MFSSSLKTIFLFVVFFAIWLILDVCTKLYFDSGAFYIGQNISGSILGIFHFTLVHNTGAAFGMFGDSTYILSIISIIVSIFFVFMLLMHLFKTKNDKTNYKITFFHVFSISVICAGGIGNAIDRITKTYVVDFICLDFIDFPVFNIADIGVTCGVILLIICMFINIRRENGNKKLS